MLADEPGDAFLRYGIALEWEKEGDNEKCVDQLRDLMQAELPYVPAFFMAAQNLAKRNEIDTARSFLRDGIEEARKQGDTHAAGEMSEFLATLGAA